MTYFYGGIFLLNLLALLTVLFRPALFGNKLYKPMLKNIWLSVLPVIVLLISFLVSLNLGRYGYMNDNRTLIIVGFIGAVFGFIIWLLLLPNAGYLITELNLNHRTIDKVEVPLWYDIIGVLTLSMSGVVNTMLNVMLVQMIYISMFYPTRLFEITFSTHPQLWIIISVLFVLVSFGIYIGRYIRFNSWDVLHPAEMLRKFRSHVREKGNKKNMFLFVLFYALFFFLIYLIIIIPMFQSGVVWH